MAQNKKKFVENWFDKRGDIILHTSKDEKGKYGRYIARVFADRDDLSKDLIDEWEHVKAEY